MIPCDPNEQVSLANNARGSSAAHPAAAAHLQHGRHVGQLQVTQLEGAALLGGQSAEAAG